MSSNTVGNLAILAMLVSAAPVAAQKTDASQNAPAANAATAAQASPAPSDVYDVLYARYLESARRTATPPNGGPSIDWMTNLARDRRARGLNDLVTIRVFESIEGAGTADSALNKNSSASAGVSQLFGVEKKLPSMIDPTNLVGAAADTKFKGGGATTRTGQLTATITARVVEVLPNGDLVLEGAREVDINGDRQIVVLTGVARQADIDERNIVPSPQIGQLRIRYFGRGLIKDNLRPGFLVRMLNKIF
jgi:flagellar L-ring protein precursor FlgH